MRCLRREVQPWQSCPGPWLQLTTSHCRDGEESPTSSPNDVAYIRASLLKHNLWPSSQMLRGLFMWLCKRRGLLEWGGNEQRHREGETKEWIFLAFLPQECFPEKNWPNYKSNYFLLIVMLPSCSSTSKTVMQRHWLLFRHFHNYM